ncbi:MAG TPA: hypothetical protein PLJ27_25685, partial [Polyangiaceae bacterium]|nr:hypothetical protein [Polyangiaceae bacterium]
MIAITVLIPITIPSVVRRLRIVFDRSDSTARRPLSINPWIMFCPPPAHPTRSGHPAASRHGGRIQRYPAHAKLTVVAARAAG